MIKENNVLNKAGDYGNRLLKFKLLPAIWTGKILIALTRLLGRGGTTLPGRIAQKFTPDLDGKLARQITKGNLIITGTNGKTTTSALITAILKEADFSCIHNQSGSNMTWGVVSALVEAASLNGRLSADFAVMEVDEGAFPAVTKAINPRGVIVTNIFRDQLDRYGEIDHVQDAIRRGLVLQSEGSFRVLNADDPTLMGFDSKEKVTSFTYGLELNLPDDAFQESGRDLKTCPVCSEKLHYDKIYFAHLGHFRCLSCGYRRPEPDVKLIEQSRTFDGKTSLIIDFAGEELILTTLLPGIYNLYNILAAVTCAKALKVPNSIISRAVGKAAPAFGRMEFFRMEGKSITMALIKNPVGANEVLRTILTEKNKTVLLVAINDKIADGTDISWLWDVDFEKLFADREIFSVILVSGLRAMDMALRLKYAGFETDRIQIEEITTKALEKALYQTADNGNLFILPNYTAMLEIRRALNQMGLGKAYWEVNK